MFYSSLGAGYGGLGAGSVGGGLGPGGIGPGGFGPGGIGPGGYGTGPGGAGPGGQGIHILFWTFSEFLDCFSSLDLKQAEEESVSDAELIQS